MAEDIHEILKKNKNLILLSVIFFIIGGVAGFLSFEKTEGQILPVLKDVVFANIIEESKFQTALNILSRNLWATAILLISGFTVILSLVILFFNGFIFGFVSKLTLTRNLGIDILIKGVLPHSIFELPAFLISAAIGIRAGIIIFGTRKDRIQNLISHLKELIFIYLFLIIPLLVIAAFVEAFVSASLVLG